MPNIAERMSYVEGQVSELSLRLSGVEAAIVHVEQRMDARFDAIDRRLVWIVGVQITILVAMLDALLSRG